MSFRSRTGGALGADAIRNRLARGEIFAPDSYLEANLRAAAYDMRIAPDFMTVPIGEGEARQLRTYLKGENYSGDVVFLTPGENAIVSTAEKMRIPWDLTAHIGIKFRYSRSAILVSTGLLVDPGFGYRRGPRDSWIPEDDERLHFLLTNIGERPYELRPGDAIASIQFFTVVGDVRREYVASAPRVQEKMAERLSNAPRFVLEQRLRNVERELSDHRTTLHATERATERVVVFGVFLVSATLLGITLAVLLDSLGGDSFTRASANIERALTDSPLAVVTVVAVVLAIVYLPYLLARRQERGPK